MVVLVQGVVVTVVSIHVGKVGCTIVVSVSCGWRVLPVVVPGGIREVPVPTVGCSVDGTSVYPVDRVSTTVVGRTGVGTVVSMVAGTVVSGT